MKKKYLCNCCLNKVSPIDIIDNFLQNPLNYCTNCGHIQLKINPTNKELIQYYETIYSKGRQINKVYLKTMRSRARAQTDYISQHISIEKINNTTDYGCGYGFLLSEMKKYSDIVHGYEYDPECINYIKKKDIPVDILNDESDITNFNEVDLITMSHVLEHVRDVNFVLSTIKTKSKYLFIEVPFYDINCGGQWKDQLGHINFFNEHSLKSLLDRVGFKVIDVTKFGPSLHYYYNPVLNSIKKSVFKVLFFCPPDSFFGQTNRINEKGIWIRAIVKCD